MLDIPSLILEYSHRCSPALNNEDHPVTRRDASDITAVELAALHHELAVGPLRWFAHFAMERHWRSSEAVYRQMQRGDPNLVHRWYVRPIEFGRRGSHGGARETDTEQRSCSDPDNVSPGDAQIPSLRHVARQIQDFKETEPGQRRFRGRVWWCADGAGGGMVLDVVKLTCAAVEAVGKE